MTQPPQAEQQQPQLNKTCSLQNNSNTNINDDDDDADESYNNNNNSNSKTATTQLQQQQKLGSSSDFKIRTQNHRHLDFDGEYDLSDPLAKQRSRFTKPWFFIQAADTQFGMIDSYIRHKTEPGWLEEIELSLQLVAAIDSMPVKPAFMIICGDLVDAWPTQRQIREQQIRDFKSVFSKLSIPLVCVCGNHDVGNEPTFDAINAYKRDFGDDYFYFTLNDVLFIVINSQFYQNRTHCEDYARDQDSWLESMLEKCKLFKYSLVFEHIPWFLVNAEEEDDYFNIQKQTRLKWLQKFKCAGVTKIMCGHYHRNAGGWYGDMEQVVTSAIGAQIGNDKSGARIVKILHNSIEHKYYSIDEMFDYKFKEGNDDYYNEQACAAAVNKHCNTQQSNTATIPIAPKSTSVATKTSSSESSSSSSKSS